MTLVQGGKLVQNWESGLFPRRLRGFQVNPDAALERRNDPAVSSNADPLDIGRLAHVRRGLFDVAPLARHRKEGDLAGLGPHICCEHSRLLRDGERMQVGSTRLRQRSYFSRQVARSARMVSRYPPEKSVNGYVVQQRQFARARLF
jgi:hypothetical protein